MSAGRADFLQNFAATLAFLLVLTAIVYVVYRPGVGDVLLMLVISLAFSIGFGWRMTLRYRRRRRS